MEKYIETPTVGEILYDEFMLSVCHHISSPKLFMFRYQGFRKLYPGKGEFLLIPRSVSGVISECLKNIF